MALSKGVEIRAGIDDLTVKALLTLNGGGSVALMALAPVVVDENEFPGLLDTVFGAVMVLVLGMGLAVIHNICRRKCSLHHEHHNMSPPKGRVLGILLWEPGICAASTVCKWLSLVAFMGGGLAVAMTGLYGAKWWP